MTTEELAALAFHPLSKKFKNPRLLNFQKIIHPLLLVDLGTVKTGRLDQRGGYQRCR
jgi:hypothetical protein